MVNTTILGYTPSTTEAMNIYVDKAATGSGTGVDYTNAFTTIQAAINSLPTIISHAVTIYIRKGSTPYRETVTIQRTISGGSLALQGEYYHNYQCASNSTSNRLVKNASDDFTDVEVGDQVFLVQYSGTYVASEPSAIFYGSVSDVTNKASGYVTISMDSAVTPTTGFNYIICKTEISGSDDGETPTRSYIINTIGQSTIVSITGLYLSLPNSIAILDTSAGSVTLTNCIINAGAKASYKRVGSGYTTITYSLLYGNSSGAGWQFYAPSSGSSIALSYGGIVGKSTGTALLYMIGTSLVSVDRFIIRALGGSTSGCGMNCTSNGAIRCGTTLITGAGSGDKLGTGYLAVCGGQIYAASSANVTTAKTPANWAATSDGSYIT